MWQGENKWPGRARRKKKSGGKKKEKKTQKKAKEKKKKKKKKKVLTKETDPWGDTLVPSMKSKNMILLDGALVGAG